MGLLRFLLALSVVIAHSGPVFGFTLVGGQLAVQAFYIISGFYMSLILNEKYVGKNGSYPLFISNRLLRLLPVYWVVLLLTLGCSMWISVYTEGEAMGRIGYYQEHMGTMSWSSLAFLLFTHLFVVLQDMVMFMGVDPAGGYLYFTTDFRQSDPALFRFLLVPQAWTVGVEIMFYLVAPFLLRRKLKIIFWLILLSFSVRGVLIWLGLRQDPWTYRFFPAELCLFLLGTVAYHGYKKLRTLHFPRRYSKIAYGGVLVLTCCFQFLEVRGLNYLYLLTFFCVLPMLFSLSKNWKMDRYIGELSYPVYISHLLILMVLSFFTSTPAQALGLPLVMGTILFSVLLHELVAKKVEYFRQQRVRPKQSSITDSPTGERAGPWKEVSPQTAVYATSNTKEAEELDPQPSTG